MGRDESVFEGKSLDDAVRKGLSDLGLTRAEVMITVLEEGSGGFLGIGARPYRVRVVPRPGGAIREPDDRGSDRGERRGGRGRDRGPGRERDRGRGREERGAREARGPRAERSRGDRADRGDRSSRAEPPGGRDDRRERAEPRAEPRADQRRDERRERPSRPERSPQRVDAAREERRPQPPPRREEMPERLPPPGAPLSMDADGGRRRRRRRRGGRSRGTGDEAPEVLAPGAPPLEQESEYSPPEPVAIRANERTETRVEERVEEQVDDRGEGRRGPPRDERRDDRREMGREPRGDEMPGPELEREATRLAGELLSRMGYEAQVSARAEGTRVDVHAVVPEGGDDLTGPKGEVRQALQHILNRMLNRGGGSTYHLQLEVNDFWERREVELQELARRLAEEALRTNGEVVTEYLNSQERRIVHVTLKVDARVKTYALGTGLIKRVAIAPADYPEPEAGDE